MSDDMAEKRAFVTSLYSGPRWKREVRAMPDSQVIAIYLREKNKPKKPKDDKESGSDELPF